MFIASDGFPSQLGECSCLAPGGTAPVGLTTSGSCPCGVPEVAWRVELRAGRRPTIPVPGAGGRRAAGAVDALRELRHGFARPFRSRFQAPLTTSRRALARI